MITTAGVSDEETGKFRREGPAVDKNPAEITDASSILLIRRRHFPHRIEKTSGIYPRQALPPFLAGATDFQAIVMAWRIVASSAWSSMTRVQPLAPQEPLTGWNNCEDVVIRSCCSSGDSFNTARPSLSRNVAKIFPPTRKSVTSKWLPWALPGKPRARSRN